ncbi:hypothetical protein EYF80_021740 [Liparis tanakae]|uniref:Uncharacterized protein n=1 Tax=Liparis tanakae TaxID=230148 RepID=A0A4Z2HS05_9TELE|nr:hypothetical protein EYF80_021740 [Liparis tanakae]
MDVEQLRFAGKFKRDVSDLLERVHPWDRARLLPSGLHFTSEPVPLPGPEASLLQAEQHSARLHHEHQGEQLAGAQHLTCRVMRRTQCQQSGIVCCACAPEVLCVYVLTCSKSALWCEEK